VLSDSEFDASGLPPNMDLRSLVGRVFDDLANGVEPGYYALLAAVLSGTHYPRNRLFLELARRYAPELLPGSSAVLETEKILQTIRRNEEIQMVVREAGLRPERIDFAGPPGKVWPRVFDEAALEGKVDALLDAVGTSRPAVRRALEEVRGRAPGSEAPAPPIPARILAREAPWYDVPGPEAVIDESAPTLVDVVFFAQGLDRARSVCRLVPWFAGRQIGSGTGFRIGADLILTSRHVLFDRVRGGSRALHVEAWFNYEVDEQGVPRKKVEIPCDIGAIVAEEEHDWAVIRAREPIPDAFPALRIGAARVPSVGDRVSIIQHPQRLPKKVAFHHNLIRAVEPDRILYLTDTDEGSSGSPVFDQDWSVVAMHHWTLPAPEGERSKWWNQGRRMDRLIDRMTARGINLPAG
jgi:V8-like Glu-specific endopeptidase